MKTRQVTPDELYEMKQKLGIKPIFWEYQHLADRKLVKNMPKDCVGIYRNEYIVVK